MAMFGNRRMPAPSAQDLADFNEVLRRAGGLPDGAVFNDNPSYANPAPAQPATPPVAPPQGMFGNSTRARPFEPPAFFTTPPIAPQKPDMSTLDTGVGTIKPHFNDVGGLAGKLGQAGAILQNYAGNPTAMQVQTQKEIHAGDEAKQANMLQRQIAFEQFKLAHPQDPAILKTADALFPRGSAQWQQFVKTASLTPHLIGIPNMAGGTDYMDPTGMSGPGGGGAPVSKVINGQTYYNINGEWYDNPEGK